jgi:hypothetical protein
MKTKASKVRFLFVVWLAPLALSFCNGIVRADDEGGEDTQHHSTAQNFLRLDVRPIAIGHHGVGPYPAGTPGLPTENTVDSVRQAYSLGARVVEVDVQLTADGKLAVFHDDLLSDYTCVRGLTLAELQQRLPYVPELQDVLKIAREFNKKAGDDLGGILIVELKTFSPLCDPRDEFEHAVISAAVPEIRNAHMDGR